MVICGGIRIGKRLGSRKLGASNHRKHRNANQETQDITETKIKKAQESTETQITKAQESKEHHGPEAQETIGKH